MFRMAVSTSCASMIGAITLTSGSRGKHDGAFRNRINITGEMEILQIVQKILLENAEALQDNQCPAVQISDSLIYSMTCSRPAMMAIAAVHRVVSEKCIKDNGFVTILVFEVALHHRQFV